MTRTIAVLLFIMGFVVGIGAAGGYQYWHERTGRIAFAHNADCLRIARQYENDISDKTTSVSVNEVNYDTARNSCLGKVTTFGPSFWSFEVVDLLSRRILWLNTCSISSGDCTGAPGTRLKKLQDYQYQKFLTQH